MNLEFEIRVSQDLQTSLERSRVFTDKHVCQYLFVEYYVFVKIANSLA